MFNKTRNNDISLQLVRIFNFPTELFIIKLNSPFVITIISLFNNDMCIQNLVKHLRCSFQLSTIFTKSSILDKLQRSEYVSDKCRTLQYLTHFVIFFFSLFVIKLYSIMPSLIQGIPRMLFWAQSYLLLFHSFTS